MVLKATGTTQGINSFHVWHEKNLIPWIDKMGTERFYG